MKKMQKQTVVLTLIASVVLSGCSKGSTDPMKNVDAAKVQWEHETLDKNLSADLKVTEKIPEEIYTYQIEQTNFPVKEAKKIFFPEDKGKETYHEEYDDAHDKEEELNLEINKGTICGLVGRNGSGKTMLMKSICGFIPSTEGIITVFGERVGIKDRFAQNLGFIIETPGFIPNYSAMKNLEFLSAINSKVDKEKIREVIKLVGLDPDSKKKVGKFSLGMNQRLGLAQAIIDDPDLLILDEPFNGLDNDGVKQIRNLLLKLKEQGKTIIMASHTKEDIDILCDKVCYMDKGRLTLG